MSANPRVLVVDDEPQLRRALRLVLRANGYDVTEVASGEAALDAAVSQPWDLMILDLMLPDLDGVEVLDDGPGVPPTERERLFRAFERGQTRAAGTGLGLTIARGFVEAHGGRLWLEGVQTHGSRFVFTLPVWSPAAA